METVDDAKWIVEHVNGSLSWIKSWSETILSNIWTADVALRDGFVAPVVLIYEIDGISHLHKVTKQQVLLQVPVNGAFFHAIQIHVRTVNSHLPPWFTMLIFLSSRSCIHMFKPEFVGVIRLTFIRLTHRNSMNFHTAHLKSFKSSMSIPRKPSISHLGCFFPVEANCQFYGLAKLKKNTPFRVWLCT